MDAPHYIALESLRAAPVTYAWNDYDPYEVIPAAPAGLEDILQKAHFNAQLGFAIACAEWVVYRLSALTSRTDYLDHVEAKWAERVAYRLVTHATAVDTSVDDAVGGMIQLALVTVDNIQMNDGDDQQAQQAAFGAAVARHAQPDPAAFDAWALPVAKRVADLYPREGGKDESPLIVREAFDPAVDAAGKEEKLAEAFYASLEGTESPFIRKLDRWVPYADMRASAND